MKENNELVKCYICGNNPVINLKEITVSCHVCGLKTGFDKKGEKAIPENILSKLLIELWNTLKTRKPKIKYH